MTKKPDTYKVVSVQTRHTPSVEYWLRKVARILRGVWDTATIHAVKVAIGGDKWYDVTVWNQYNTLIHMDVLDKDEVNAMLRAFAIHCGEPTRKAEFQDGFNIRFENCVDTGQGGGERGG